MYSQTFTGSLHGLEAELVTVETDLSPGLPGVTVVGLPDTSVREARERIRTAMSNAGYCFPTKRITVNLSPADSKKEGTHFDLPIAVGIMAATGDLKAELLKDYAFMGELSLNGKINGIHGALPLAIGLRNRGIRKLILPFGNKEEVSILEDMEIYPVGHLSDVDAHFSGYQVIKRYIRRPRKSPAPNKQAAGDFADVAGQEEVKRALQVAAAAAHNLLMIGPPGAGKTMMARLVPGILPAMTYEERLEVTKIYSIAGELPESSGIIEERPFRSPHHTISPIALIGGGRRPMPGEVSLAHYGVLFLDELPEFQRKVLEVLRQPLEDERVNIARAVSTITYPAKIMLIASMNPCPCGYFGSDSHTCTCTDYQIHKYMSKISGPLLDRIDIHIEIMPVPFEQLMGVYKIQKKLPTKNSLEMRTEVEAARKIQLQRYKSETIFYNSQLTPKLIKKYCPLDKESTELLKQAFEKYNLSARVYQKIIKLARTIADLEGKQQITLNHIAEAIRYRSLDKNYWKEPDSGI
ncbi:MAG: YifB family Mg chelatase-like AAA ATPase [Anaerovoracaceae bacterium]|jgi:magnesium chelatase family protein